MPNYKVFTFEDLNLTGPAPEELAKLPSEKISCPIEIARLYGVEFSESQAQAAVHAPGTQAIVAPAGSGKTMVISARIASLLRIIGPYLEHEVFATSFTREATRNLRTRVNKLLGRESSAQITTFHSMAQNMVFKHAADLGYAVQPTVLTRSSASMRLKSVILEVTGASKLSEIEEFSDQNVLKWMYGLDVLKYVKGIEKDDISDFLPPDELFIQISNIHRLYHHYNLQDAVIDFDEILTLALAVLLKNGAWCFPARHVFVDEAQDLNAIQWEILRLARPKFKSLVLIGDDDQSIYRFRGARPKEFLAFVKGADKLHVLPENRRSLTKIVQISDDLMASVPEERRVKKTIKAVRGDAGEVLFLAAPNLKTLLAEELSSIKDGYSKHGSDYLNQFAFLQRYSGQTGKLLQGLLLSMGLPYVVRGGGNVFEDAEAQYIKSVIAAIDRRAKFVSSAKVANEMGAEVSRPPYSASSTFWAQILDALGVSPDAAVKLVTKARELSLSRDCLFEETLLEAAKTSRIKPESKTYITDSVNIVQTAADAVVTDPRGSFRSIILATALFDIVGAIASKEATRIASGRQKRGGLSDEKAKILASELTKSRVIGLTTSLEPVMDMALTEVNAKFEIDDVASTGERDNAGRIVLTTVHSAKGLEWNTVYLLDVAGDVWPPGWSTNSDDDFDEERRLFYVAITRAKDSLKMIAPGPGFGGEYEFKSCPFLDIRIQRGMERVVSESIKKSATIGVAIPTVAELNKTKSQG